MKPLLPILLWLWPCLATARAKEVFYASKTDTIQPVSGKTMAGKTAFNTAIIPKTYVTTDIKPEILTSGFIDIINNGQVNASARFIRLLIGEPGKFAIPLSIYSGVSSNNFQNQQNPTGQRSNEQLATNFINPLSGLANISVDGKLFFKRGKVKITRTGFLYHAGIRVLTGYKTGLATNPSTGRPINFLNSYCTAGLYFQTGAWERNNARNVGVFWLAGRYIICKSGKDQLKEIMPDIQTRGFYHGWSLAWGVEINNLVDIKVVYYKYEKRPEIVYSLPIYQFSFNYSLR